MIQKSLTVLLFFPSLTFNILQSEIFPWAILKYGLMRQRLSYADLVVISLIMLGAIVGLFTYPFMTVISTAASYLNPILAFILIRKSSAYLTERVLLIVKKLFWIFVSVALLQLFGVLSVLDPLFDLLIPRGGSLLASGDRGVSIFATEPSRASVEIIFLYALLVTYRGNSMPSFKGTLLQDLIFFFFILFVCRSITGLIFFLIFFILRRPISAIPIGALGSLVITFFVIETRSSLFIISLFEQQGLSGIIQMLTLQSGFRVISVVSGYIYALNTWVGMGVGAWTSEAILSYKMAGYSVTDTNFFIFHHNSELVNLKPTAFIALVALEFGLFGLIIVSWYVLKQFKPGMLCSCKDTRTLILMSLFYIFFIGAVGNPIPWICGALAMNLFDERTRSHKNSMLSGRSI